MSERSHSVLKLVSYQEGGKPGDVRKEKTREGGLLW